MGRYANVNLENLAFLNDSSLSEKKENFKITNIHIDKIVPNEKNQYSIQDIEELKFSILNNGLKQNLEVYSTGDGKYKLISGERRYTVLKALVDGGYDEFSFVPCLVTDFSLNKLPLSDASKEMYAIITTNSDSREFTVADRMFQIKELKKIYTELQNNGVKLTGKMSELIAKDLDLSEKQIRRFNYVENHGTDELIEKVENNKISIRAAEAVAHLTPSQQREALSNENITSSIAESIKMKSEKKKSLRAEKNQKEIKLSETSFFTYDLAAIKDKIQVIEKVGSTAVLKQYKHQELEIKTQSLNRILDNILNILER